jgi:uncharacterized protein (DUF58 family)
MNNQAREIILRAKKDVFSGSLGNNLTTFKGEGLNFREIRDYSIGDDVKKINWKATAKSNTIKINVFDNEQELNILVAFFANGSIKFGSKNIKQDVMSEVLALLSFSAIRQHDNLSNVIFTNNNNQNYYPSFKNEYLLEEIVTQCLEINTEKLKIDFCDFCDFINNKIKNKTLIFLIGDFYEDIDLSSISHKNEIYSIIVRDRFEEYPMLNGNYNLTDPTTMQYSDIYINKNVANKYNELIKKHDEKLTSHFKQHMIKYGKIYTDDDIYVRLSQIIKG